MPNTTDHHHSKQEGAGTLCDLDNVRANRNLEVRNIHNYLPLYSDTFLKIKRPVCEVRGEGRVEKAGFCLIISVRSLEHFLFKTSYCGR
jgi:hypothetical protein